MEENKFLPPKFSFACKDLATLFNVSEQSTAKSTLSKTSSNLSIVSVPGLKDSKPISPHSQLELQTIRENDEKQRFKAEMSKTKNMIMSAKNTPRASFTKTSKRYPYSSVSSGKQIYSQRNSQKPSPRSNMDVSRNRRKRSERSSYSSQKKVTKPSLPNKTPEVSVSVRSPKRPSNSRAYLCKLLRKSQNFGIDFGYPMKFEKVKGHKRRLPEIAKLSPLDKVKLSTSHTSCRAKTSVKISNDYSTSTHYNFGVAKGGKLSVNQHRKILAHLTAKHGFKVKT